MNISLLPDEIKIKIFQYLNGIDKVEILRVCKDFHRIGLDRKILECLDFSYNYKITLKSHLKFFGRKVTLDFVTTINVNGIYWIPSAELRNCLVKFENLSALHVVDTQLSYRDLVVVLNSATGVRKLAFSLRPDNCGDVYLVKIECPITHLYVTFYSHQIKCLFRLLAHFSNLEELWLIEPSYPHKIIHHDFTIDPMPLTKIPYISKRIVISQRHDANSKLNNFPKYYKDGLTYTNNWETIIRTDEKYNYFSVFEKRTSKTTNQNDGFNVHSLEKYVTVIDAKNIRNSDNIEFLRLTGLNFYENNPQINKHIRTILTALPCTSSLTKWRGLSEFFWEEKQIVKADTSLFKKRRIGVSFPKLDENNLFARFTRHTPEMQDFEIIDENNESIRKQMWQTDSLKFMRNWKMLRSLTITSVNLKYGKFIVDVLANCTLLSRLKIQDDSFQDDFSADLCNGLKHAINLKDFRYERKGSIPMDKLFEALVSCKKLERIFVCCRSAEVISKTPIETVLTVCENLINFFILITELPETVCRSIKQGIQDLSLKPQQIVFIKGQTYVLDTIMYNDMPMYHIEDMVCQSNNFHFNFIRSCF